MPHTATAGSTFVISQLSNSMESAFWPRQMDRYLSGRRSGALESQSIFLVEDEYVIAADLEQALRAEGAHVVNRGTFKTASHFVLSNARVDSAILDIKIGDHLIFPVADALIERGVRIVFLTGCNRKLIPERFARVRCFEKPVQVQDLVVALLSN